MARLKDAHPILRPREKLIRYGVDRLSNAELLALLLRSGTKKVSSVELAQHILDSFDELSIQQLTTESLCKIDGIGRAKACEIIACFELGRRFLKDKKATLLLTPQDIFDELRDIRKSKKEHFVVFFLDVRNQEIRREIISIGILDTNIVHPREVFEPAIKYSAAQVIFAHNHPSGNPSPSDEDIIVTKRLFDAGNILGISVIDHVIVAPDSFFSFKEEGLLEFRR